MSLTAGTRIGVYEIIDKLGEGGMGEVYRARDTKLGRQVAIKVLPPTVSGSADRLARFEREARTLASLNHPNVAQVFGLEESVIGPDGQAGPGGTSGATGLFLIMELLEGHALSDLLEQGALTTRKAIDYGGQIARGLSAAHDRGIIHRDLKPDNIFVLPDGRVKILDFGLARQADVTEASVAGTMLTRERFTDPGTVMGTAGYMAPEQVRAEPTDARSDLFSLGVVLYEMLAGRRAFRRETTVETMTAILREDPPDLTTLRTDISPSLLRIVHRCLEKSPSGRFQTASDLAFALDAISGSTPGSGTQAIPRPATAPATAAVADDGPEPGTAGQAKPRKVPSNRAFIWAALGMSFGLAFMLVNRLVPDPEEQVSRAPAPTTAPAYRASVVFPEGVKPTELGLFGGRIALSPDGTKVAFSGGARGAFRPPDRIWILTLEDGSVRELEGTLGADQPSWSPDSQQVYFTARDSNGLKRVSVLGGQPVPVANVGGTIATASDGSVLLFELPRNGRALRISGPGAEALELFRMKPGQAGGFPRFLDDGRRFLYTQDSGPGSTDKSGAFVASLDAPGTSSLVVEGAEIVNADLAGDYLVYSNGSTLMAQRFDQSSARLVGAPYTLATDVLWAAKAGAAFSASRDVLAYVPQPYQQNSRLQWLDRQGREVATLADAANYSNVELSPDDRRVLVSALDEGRRTRDMYIVDVERKVRQRLTFEAGDERSAVWSADGRRAIYYKDRELFGRPSDFTGTEESVLSNGASKDPRGVSHDGRRLLFRQTGPQGNDIWEMPLEGDRTPKAVLTSPFDENYAGYSPDGRSMVYCSNESGRYEIYVLSLDGSGGKTLLSNAGGLFPRWRRDGKEIIYLSLDQNLISVPVSGTGASFKAGASVELFHITPQPGPGSPFDVSADGRHFIVNAMVPSRIPPSLTLIVNWPALVQRQGNQ